MVEDSLYISSQKLVTSLTRLDAGTQSHYLIKKKKKKKVLV